MPMVYQSTWHICSQTAIFTSVCRLCRGRGISDTFGGERHSGRSGLAFACSTRGNGHHDRSHLGLLSFATNQSSAQSRRLGLASQIENMKHYKVVLSIFRISSPSPPHKRKSPHWRLSGDVFVSTVTLHAWTVHAFATYSTKGTPGLARWTGSQRKRSPLTTRPEWR